MTWINVRGDLPAVDCSAWAHSRKYKEHCRDDRAGPTGPRWSSSRVNNVTHSTSKMAMTLRSAAAAAALAIATLALAASAGADGGPRPGSALATSTAAGAASSARDASSDAATPARHGSLSAISAAYTNMASTSAPSRAASSCRQGRVRWCRRQCTGGLLQGIDDLATGLHRKHDRPQRRRRHRAGNAGVPA
jgi:hypothetical protein